MSRLALFGGPRAMTQDEPEAPILGEGEVSAVLAALHRFQEGDGPALSSLSGSGPVEELEERFRDSLDVRHALALSSGTAALHTALAACGVEREDEVILSPYDWGAGVACVLQVGAVPVFADIDPLTYTLDPRSAAERITGRTAAIVVTHLFGHPANLESLVSLAQRHGLRLIEDGAQALGASYRGEKVGALGDAGCFSLGPGKAVTGGEGGVLVTHSGEVFERAVRFSQHPLRQVREGVESNPFGLNYRIHPLAASIAGVQLEALEQRLRERRANAQRLSQALEGLPGIRPVTVAPGCEHAFHRYSPTYLASAWEGVPREALVEALAAEGVPVCEGFIRRPLYRHLEGQGRPWSPVCPVAERRCASEELGLGHPPAWRGDLTGWSEGIAAAIRKVYDRRGCLKEREVR